MEVYVADPDKIFKSIDSGDNLLLHGAGGTGKSYMISKIIDYLEDKGIEYALCAPTGIAALNIGGTTIHRWAGIGNGNDDVEYLIKDIIKKHTQFMKIGGTFRSTVETAYNRWFNTSILIIDEVSMLGSELFEKLDKIARKIRDDIDHPFGDMKIILVGDFLQLPPIKANWIFHSNIWSALNLRVFIFHKVHRQNDNTFIRVLNGIRKGILSEESLEFFKKCHDQEQKRSKEYIPGDIEPIKLHFKNKDVLGENMEKLKSLPGESTIYYSLDRVFKDYRKDKPKYRYNPDIDKYENGIISGRYEEVPAREYKTILDEIKPQIVTLKKGAIVMLLANVSIEDRLVNGSRGVVLELGHNYVQVCFENGVTKTLGAWPFEDTYYADDSPYLCVRTRMPLMLSWSSTIHKSQSLTLDSLVVNLNGKHSALSYVALSRVRSPDGLYISSYNTRCVKADQNAIKFVNDLEFKCFRRTDILSELNGGKMPDERANIDQLVSLVQTGANLYFHGGGGCGKSYNIKQLNQQLLNKKIALTALTGVASYNLGGQTLHSWAGVGIADKPAEELAQIINFKQYANTAYSRWVSTHILIIDEISMFGKLFFEKLSRVGSIIRKDERPFGGIQLILAGDFLQLPPVNDDWCFKSPLWQELNLVSVPFTTPYRQRDPDFYQLLTRIRFGKLSEPDYEVLKSRYEAYDQIKLNPYSDRNFKSSEIFPTILYSKRVDVSGKNREELDRLPGEEKIYLARDETLKDNELIRNHKAPEQILADLAPDKIFLKVGAQVMLTVNFDTDHGLVNGSRGVVIAIHYEGVEVKFLNQQTLILKPHRYEFSRPPYLYRRKQIPLILAWALSIHKIQSASLDSVVVDLGPSIFQAGMAYVALSRVRALDGLYLSALSPKSIRANKEALEFVRMHMT